MSSSPEEKPVAPEPSDSNTVPPVNDTPRTEPMTDHEKSLLEKVGEVGEETVKKLKEIFSEVDREELRKSVNRDQIQRSIASTLNSLNAKAQAFLAPKDETTPKSDPLHSETTLNTSADAPGPVGTEAVGKDADTPPDNETRNFS